MSMPGPVRQLFDQLLQRRDPSVQAQRLLEPLQERIDLMTQRSGAHDAEGGRRQRLLRPATRRP